MTKVPPALRVKWEKRLAASGFEDIEHPDGRLKEDKFLRRKTARPTDHEEPREAQYEYYRMVAAYITTAELTRLERKIMELHSDGKRLEPISLEVYRSVAYVKNCIYKHRKIILHRS